MKNDTFNGFYHGMLHDARLEKRTEKMMMDMLDFGNVVVNKFCSTHTEKIGAYRMLSNDSFDYQDLIGGMYKACQANQHADHLLCIQDTTEINFNSHKDRLSRKDKDLGPVTKEDMPGFFCHPMLVIDPEIQIPIGFASINLWNRSWGKTNKYERDYSNIDISEKESYRWITSAQQTKKLLTETKSITIIADRESDIYDEFALIPDQRTHLLIRSKVNRKLWGEEVKLFEKLSSSDQKSLFELKIKHNHKRASRTAKMSLKYEKVKICQPNTRPGYPAYVELWAIEAKELPDTTPFNEAPVLWRLLTTHPIHSVEDALRYIEWYSYRWLIEEIFRILKSSGLAIESSQLETGAALKKLVVIALQVALVSMSLKLSLTSKNKVKATLIFNQDQLYFLSHYMPTLEGKTDKLKNPFEKGSLQWVAWAMGRMGGWSGYTSQGPPGYISIKDGYNRFLMKYDGYKVALEIYKKDVYKG